MYLKFLVSIADEDVLTDGQPLQIAMVAFKEMSRLYNRQSAPPEEITKAKQFLLSITRSTLLALRKVPSTYTLQGSEAVTDLNVC